MTKPWPWQLEGLLIVGWPELILITTEIQQNPGLSTK